MCLSPGHVTSVDLRGERQSVFSKDVFQSEPSVICENQDIVLYMKYIEVHIDCEENVEVICRQTHYMCTCSRYGQLNHALKINLKVAHHKTQKSHVCIVQ